MTGPSLRLYIAGSSPSSRRARQNLIDLQRLMKSDALQVEIIDVLVEPERAERASILATPTLAYDHPERPRRVVGDLSDALRVLDFLGIDIKSSES